MTPWLPVSHLSGQSRVWRWLIFAFGLILVSPHVLDIFRRLSRTAHIQRRPLLYIDVIVIIIASFGVTIAMHVCSHTIAIPVISHAMSVFLLAIAATLAVWPIVLFVCSRRQEAPEVSDISPIEGVSDYSDEPIQDDSQDLLGRMIFVNRRYEQILRLPFPESFVFGLHAGWGEGKTSVLNLLYRRLNGDPAVIPVVFNPRYLATEAALIQNFYASIERELQSRYLIVGLHRTLGR